LCFLNFSFRGGGVAPRQPSPFVFALSWRLHGEGLAVLAKFFIDPYDMCIKQKFITTLDVAYLLHSSLNFCS